MDIDADASIYWFMADISDDQIRTLFMQIGIIMEDTGMVALIWRDSDRLTTGDRLTRVTAANESIGALVSELEAIIR